MLQSWEKQMYSLFDNPERRTFQIYGGETTSNVPTYIDNF